MLLRTLFDDVWVYPDLTRLDPAAIVDKGEVMVRIGAELFYYEVYVPRDGTVGWVLNDNVEPLEG